MKSAEPVRVFLLRGRIEGCSPRKRGVSLSRGPHGITRFSNEEQRQAEAQRQLEAFKTWTRGAQP